MSLESASEPLFRAIRVLRIRSEGRHNKRVEIALTDNG